ncbi:MAG TPA: MBL fold metallo-hydrolase [Pseudogracilibacillus sp.]|nr:MBL fold metallo-hydrolase [Pseudogracilibacillus sp.]
MKIKEYDGLMQLELTVQLAGQSLTVSAFYLDGLLIDTGPFKKRSDMLALLEQWEIDHIILTHHHEDHTGLARWATHHLKIPVYMHALGVKKVRKRARLPLYRRLFWGKRPSFQAEEIGKSFRTAQYTWEVIYTPGHAKDHIALYNKEKKWLFGGDLFVQATPKSAYRFESIPEMIHSLRRILSYDFDVYICSHQGILENGRAQIERKLHYLIHMQQEVLHLYNEGRTLKQIQKQLLPNKHFMHYISLFENSPKHFIRSVLEGF